MKLIRFIMLAGCCLLGVWPEVVFSQGAEPFARRVAALEPQAGPLVLVEIGKPVATIIVDINATPTVRYAVQELNEHLELSTGTKLPVLKDDEPVDGPTIHLGSTELTERFGLAPRYLDADHWVVTRVGQALVLSGGDGKHGRDPESNVLLPHGTLFATYEFLERVVGVRWYWPGDLGRVVAKHQDLVVAAANWRGAPTFTARFAFNCNHDDPDLTQDDINVWWRRLRRGGTGGSPIGMHSFNDWPDRYGKSNPEYFAVQSTGHRLTETGSMGGHVCFSNPDVLRQTIAEKQSEFDETPWRRYSSIMPGDSMGLYMCRCADCLAAVEPEKGSSGQYGNYVWNFVNEAAHELRQTHPDRVITCCAYSHYGDVPEINLEPNVSVTLTIGSASLKVASSAKARVAHLERIDEWAEKTDELYVWDYWNIPRYDKDTYGAPTIFPHMIQDWFSLERGRVKGRVIQFTSFNSEGINISRKRNWADWHFDALNIYVGMQLMWNVEQDVDAMLEEFYEQFYGPAGPSIREFYDAMEAAYMDPNNKAEIWNYRSVWGDVYPRAFVETTMTHLRDAERAARGHDPYHERAEKTLKGFLPFEAASRRWAAAVEREIANETVAIRTAESKPTIDGKLDDACWRAAATATEFLDSFNSKDLHAQTEMRFVRHDKTLYVAIHALLSGLPPRRSIPDGSEDGMIWMADDSCELFLVEGLKKYQLIVGPDDIYTDNFHPDRTTPFSDAMMDWDCTGVVYKSITGENRWTAELAIPLTALELKRPTRRKPWRVNFCRNHFFKEGGEGPWQRELSTWRPTFGSFHNVERYGTLWFE